VKTFNLSAEQAKAEREWWVVDAREKHLGVLLRKLPKYCAARPSRLLPQTWIAAILWSLSTVRNSSSPATGWMTRSTTAIPVSRRSEKPYHARAVGSFPGSDHQRSCQRYDAQDEIGPGADEEVEGLSGRRASPCSPAAQTAGILGEQTMSEYIEAVGRRKTASARVRLYPGSAKLSSTISQWTSILVGRWIRWRCAPHWC
jgi:hypothetical protein